MPDRFSPERVADYARSYGPVPAPDPNPEPREPMWPYALLAAGQGADVATTLKVLSQPGYEEKNPMGLKGVLLTKAAIGPVLAYVMHQYAKRGHTKAQKVLGTLGALAGAVPAAMNARHIR